MVGTNAIKLHRERMGMSREKLATIIGKSYASIVAYEQGVRDPDSAIWIQLAELFDISIDELMCVPIRRGTVESKLEQNWLELFHVLRSSRKVPSPEERRLVARIIKVVLEGD